MATKQILKKARRQAAVAVQGTSTATVDIYELAYADQTVDAANVELTITDVAFAMKGDGGIYRGGNLILSLPAGAVGEFNFTEKIGVVLNDKANANVVVDCGSTANSTIIIQFTKGAGYNDPNRQNQGPGSL